MRRFIYVGFLSVLMLLIYVPSYAKYKITPNISIRETYNDNIFLEDSNEEDDFITTLSPSITLDYSPNSKLDINLDYGFDFRFYSSHSDLNDTSIKDTQRVALDVQARPLNRVFIDVNDIYRRVSIDVRDRTASDNSFENMTESNTFKISPYVDIPLTSTLSTRTGYRYTNIWYDDGGNNSDTHSAFVSLIKRFPFGLDVSIMYEYLAYRPEITDDSDIHQVSVKANYQVGPKLRVWIGGGKSYAGFSNHSNEDGSIWNVGSEYNLNILGGTMLSATYNESLSVNKDIVSNNPDITAISDSGTGVFHNNDSITTGVTNNKRVDLTLSTSKYIDLTINPYYSDKEEIETERKDEIYGVSANLSRSLTSKIDISIDGYWEKQKFSPQDNKVHIYSVGTSLEYLFSRHITTNIGYRYNKRNSDITNDDYDNNIVWLQAKLSF